MKSQKKIGRNPPHGFKDNSLRSAKIFFLSPGLGRSAHFDLANPLNFTPKCDQIIYGCDPYVVKYMYTKFEVISSI